MSREGERMKIWEMLINWKIKRDKQKHQLSEELLEELSEMVDKRRAELLAEKNKNEGGQY